MFIDPHLVICSRSNAAIVNDRCAWLELPPNPAGQSWPCIDDQHSEVANLGLAELLRAADETEKLAKPGRQTKGLLVPL